MIRIEFILRRRITLATGRAFRLFHAYTINHTMNFQPRKSELLSLLIQGIDVHIPSRTLEMQIVQ